MLRVFPVAVFGFVFPAKFRAYKLLPPLCLVFSLVPSTSPLRAVLFSSFTLDHHPATDATGSRSYGFLSLINYRVELGVGIWRSTVFFPHFPSCLRVSFFFFRLHGSSFFPLLSVDPPYLLSSVPPVGRGRNAPDRRTLRGIMKRHPAVNDFLNKMTPPGGRFKDKLSGTGKLSIIARSSPMEGTAVQIIARRDF